MKFLRKNVSLKRFLYLTGLLLVMLSVAQSAPAVQTKVSAAGNHSLEVKADGTLWAWGYNNYGQLGDGTTVNKTSPIQIGTDISAGEFQCKPYPGFSCQVFDATASGCRT